ncbi:MAG: hypothetical protein AMXMBFR84_40330 [Candidatus Hydrogenedentota bacterium]
MAVLLIGVHLSLGPFRRTRNGPHFPAGARILPTVTLVTAASWNCHAEYRLQPCDYNREAQMAQDEGVPYEITREA